MSIQYHGIDPIVVHIGPLAIRWYGLAYVGGLLLGWWYARRLMATVSLWRVPLGPPSLVDDFLTWVAVGIIVGGRLGHVILYEPAYYLANPIEVLQIWRQGMAFHGGLIGASIAAIAFAWRRGISSLSLLDLSATVAPIGLCLGRIANFVNGELWGRSTDVPWAMVFPEGGDKLRHPSQLYEAALEGILLGLILHVIVRLGGLKRPGLLAGSFGLGYAIARSIGELFREPDGVLIGQITVGMGYSIPMAIIGVTLIFVALKPAHSSSALDTDRTGEPSRSNEQ